MKNSPSAAQNENETGNS